MGVLKRQNELLNLKDIDILIEDTLFDSKYFRVLECPTILTQGKSSFLIGGSSYLKPGVELKFELIHNGTGKVIYTQAVSGHLEAGSRRVSIEVYDDIEPGPATLYVVSELNPETSDVNIPPEWQGIYNVRWSKQITINAAGVNTEPIYFYKQPTINVSEIFKGYLDVPNVTAVTSSLIGSGQPRDGLQSIVPTANSVAGDYPKLDFQQKANQSVIEENKPLVKLTGKGGHIGSQGKLLKTDSPAPNDYVITTDSSTLVSSLYVGQEITISSPEVDTSRFSLESYHEVPTYFSSSVMKVLNESSFVTSDVFYVHDNRTSPVTLVPAPLASQTINASYKDISTPTTSSINYVSFADMEISNLKTFSGDVHKVKIYSKAEGSLGDFEKIFDSPIESSEILFDSNEDTTMSNMGYWIDQSRITKYWESYEGNDGNGGTGTLTFDSTVKVDSMKISGSNLEYEDELRVQVKNDLNFVANGLYTFRAKLHGIKTDKKDVNGSVSKDGNFQVYVVGDAFNKDTTEASHWGVQKLEVPDFPMEVNNYDFGTIEGSFNADNTGTGKLQFKVPAGEWYISDISVKAASDTAFNPDYVKVVAPIPQLYTRPDKVRFLVEFYDVNNNIADTVIFSDYYTFQGENTSIGGTDNILSGSMYIGNAIGSGIEMAGVSSGFIRSIGYEGFTSASDGTGQGGFLMWSGSVLPDSGDSYTGVGLELVANSESYLRYRSNPSELDIRADAFYVGNSNSQYISGSGGNIEISSSNFHLSSSGDVTMQGTITAEAGNIGDWQIVNGKLSGSNATLDALGSALYKSDQGPDTNPTDGYYIDFTPGGYYVRFGTDFAVSSSGQLIASGAKIEGVLTSSEGYIAEWTIAPNTIHKITDTKYTGLSSTGDTRFFAGATSLTTTGSAPFNVKSSGDITASSVDLSGKITATSGQIAGWSIDGNDLTATNMALRAGDAIEMGSATSLNSGDGVWIGNSGYFRFGDADGSRVRWNGSNLLISSSKFYLGGAYQYISGSDGNIEISSSNFYLDNTGNVTMQGTITATAGEIGGFSISNDAIYSNNFFLSGSASGNQYFISSSNFNVKASGDISGSQVLFTGGKVGGWTLTDTTLSGGVVTLDSAGSIEVGGLADATTVATTNSGFFADSNGNVLIKGNVSGNDYLKVSAAGGIDIKTQVFDLDASTIIVDSATNSGKVALGSTPPTAYNSGDGIYLDGTGKFLFGSSSGDRIQYNGSAFTVQVGSLELDASNIEISSTNASMSLGEGNILLDGANNKIRVGAHASNNVQIVGSSTQGYIHTGKSSVTDTTAGFWLANNNSDPEFNVGSVTDYIKFNGGELDIQSQKLEISASTLQVSTTQASMSLGHSSTYPQGRLIMEGSGTPTFKMGTDVDIISMTTGSGIYMDGDGNFKFGDDDGNIAFNNGSFSITGSDVAINVTDINVSANGFQLSSNNASMSLGTNEQWKVYGGNANPYMSIGQGGTGVYGNTGLFLGYNSSLSKPQVSFVGSTGHFKFTGTDLDIKTGTLEVAASNIQLSSTNASMSLGGVPGSSANILLDGGNSKIEVGSANKVIIQGGIEDNYIVMGSKSSFTHFDQSTQGIILGMDSTVPKFEMVGSSTNYFSFDGTNLDIKLSQGFELDATNIELSSTQASASFGEGKVKILGGSGRIDVGTANKVSIQGGGTDNFIVMGDKNTGGTSFTSDTSTVGIILGMDSGVPKIEMSKDNSDYLKWDSTDGLDLKTTKMEISASNIQISSAQASMSVGPSQTNPIVLQSLGNDRFLKFGGKTDFDQTGTAGFIMGIDNGTAKFDFTIGTGNNNYLRVDGSNVDIKTPNFKLDTTNLDIDSTTSRIQVFDGSAGERVRIGEISDSASDLYGFKIYDGSGTGDGNTLVKLGEEGNRIAGWTINQTSLSSNNIIIHSSGKIETGDFASGVKGWRISSEGNGTAEFENVRIRGTLATTVFEKESVNAVGGQLLIANSSQITGSTEVSPSASAIQVENVSGFAIGEILKAKKTNATGFQTEYLYVTGSHRNNSSSETDFSGFLHVTRAYSGSLHTSSSFLAGLASNSQSYEPGQVLVSTGVIGSGFILLNANPNDTSTPYMDIIERTGSGIYDIEHKVRLGDLSGLSSGLLYGNSSPGFGLFTENVFLKGSITAMTGSIEGILHVRTDVSNQIKIGTNVDGGTNDGIYVNNNNYWYTNDKFRVGDTNYYLEWDTSNITIVPQTFELNAGSGDLQISSTNKSMSFADGDIKFWAPTATQARGRIGSNTSNAIYISGSSTDGYIYSGKPTYSSNTAGFWLGQESNTAKFNVGDGTDYIKFDGSNISMKSRAFELDANTGDLQISSTQKSMSLADGNIVLYGGDSNNAYFRLGNNATLQNNIEMSGSTTQAIIKAGKSSFSDTVNAGFVLEKTNTDSKFFIGDTNDVNHFKFDTTNGTSIKTQKFELGTSGGELQISSTEKSMSLGDGGVLLQGSANGGLVTVGKTNSIIYISGSTELSHISTGKTSLSDTTAGFWFGKNGTTSEFHVGDSTEYIKFDGTDLSIASAHLDITASNIDMTTDEFHLDATDLEISSTEKSMSLGYKDNSAQGITMVGGTPSKIGFGTKDSYAMELHSTTTDNFLKIGRDFDDAMSVPGVILGSDGGTAKIQVVKDTDEYFTFDGASFDLRTTKLNLSTDGGLTITGVDTIGSNNKILLGDATDFDTNTGFFVDGDGDFRVGTGTSGTSFLSFNQSTEELKIKTTNLNIDTTTMDIVASGSATRLSMGLSPPTDFSSNGIFLSGSGYFNLQSGANDFVRSDLTGFEISATNFRLSGSNTLAINTSKIRLGANATSTMGWGDIGIYLDNAGDFSFVQDGSNYIKGGDSNFDIASHNFTLKGGSTLLLNTSKLALDTSDASTANLTTGTGVYMNNSGHFRAGKAGNGRIEWDGTNLIMSSSTFLLGSSGSAPHTGAFISGSNGNIAISSSNFHLDASGNVTMAGIISSSEGNIAGWTIDTDEIKSPGGTVILDSDSSNGQIKLGSATTIDSGDGIYMDGGGNFRAGASDGYGIKWDTSTLQLSSSEFYLGDATNFISGSGGAINVESQQFDLSTTYLRMSSSYGSTIAMGASIPTSITGSGVFLSGSGDFLAGNHSGNKIQYDSQGGAIVMKSNTFSLDATTIVIDSSANDGKIALGASPNSSVAGTNPGIYMDGQGDFLAYGSDTNYIKFDASATSIDMKSDTFGLGTATMVISSSVNSGTFRMGTNGGPISATATTAGSYIDGTGKFNFVGDSNNYIRFSATGLEIQTPNLTASAAGAVSMKGAVTADTGYLGGTSGWKISTQLIQGMDSSTERIRFDALTGDILIDGDDALGIMFGSPGAGLDIVTTSAAYQKPFAVATTEDGSRTVMRVGSATKYIKVDTGATNVLEIAGKVTADAGQIGDWIITGSNMESNTDFYRGMKLIPNDKFVGYGSTNHQNTTVIGPFSFGVAPAGGGEIGGGYA